MIAAAEDEVTNRETTGTRTIVEETGGIGHRKGATMKTTMAHAPAEGQEIPQFMGIWMEADHTIATIDTAHGAVDPVALAIETLNVCWQLIGFLNIAAQEYTLISFVYPISTHLPIRLVSSVYLAVLNEAHQH